MIGATLTDEQLVTRLRAIADQCVAIVAMPPERRCAASSKGGASPEQAGTMSAMFVLHLAAETERRGITVWPAT